MNCPYCGAVIEDGKLFCQECGKEILVVQEDEVLFDEYLKDILNEKSGDEAKSSDDIEIESESKTKKRRYFIFAIIFSVFLLAVLIFIVFQYNKRLENERANSYDYQLLMGQEAYMQGHLSDAIAYYKRAIVLQPEEIELRLRLATIYTNLTEYDQARYYYLEILQLDPKNYESYKNLIDIYEKNENQDAILELLKQVDDSKILELFEDYIVTNPIISEESGTYDNYLEIELFSNGGYTILYTTDNSDPVLYGRAYTEPITYTSKGSYIIKAVCLNAKGIYSDTITREYKVVIPPPKTPVVLPDGGEFAEETYVTIDVQPGCIAYYTWDGTDPNIESFVYTEPILIPNGNNVLSVILIQTETGQTSPIYRQYFKYFP